MNVIRANLAKLKAATAPIQPYTKYVNPIYPLKYFIEHPDDKRHLAVAYVLGVTFSLIGFAVFKPSKKSKEQAAVKNAQQNQH